MINMILRFLTGGLLSFAISIAAPASRAAGSAEAKPVAIPSTFEWSPERSPPRQVFALAGGTFAVIRPSKPEDDGPRIVFSAPGAADQALQASSWLPGMGVAFRADRLDPTHSVGDITVSWFSGGAHCCTIVKVASLIAEKWKIVDVGEWDGNRIPAPRTGSDGIPVWPTIDDTFNYAFAAYAFSGAPLKLLRLVNGNIVNVSGDPRYRLWHLEDMAKWHRYCTDQTSSFRNGFCAAYVASASRVGRFEQAWAIMLKNQEQTRLEKMTFCVSRSDGKCEREVYFTNFPDALHWFLRNGGYPVD